MQIMINIPDAIKEMADEDDNRLIHLMWMLILVDAIKNGVVLPKGHGRLIECERLQEVFRRNVVGYAGFKQLFDSAPTIIEADKEK